MNYSHYTTVLERDVKDLNSKAILLRHEKTGARVFVLSNQDHNKVFYIGFRTTPSDDTGVAHIMEHSVLCGSEKYPLKDPFVELAKGSMNTFLNAMTYPDKTVYPVASTNEKDFRNLMSVYMDAVFHPNIYHFPQIMKQEGWSYSIRDKEDPIEYNGVVYNEMKGVFSSPESVLERETLHAMFPDTAYGKESGGDPRCIPDLTYEQFLDFHRTYYHPSNSFIYLYGDMDIAERLEWMDKEYLFAYDAIDVDSEVKDQSPFEKMVTVEKEFAVSEEEPLEQNTYLSFNLHCGDNLDPCKYYALQMIQYALVDTQGAPIRQRLLDEGIGKDILSGFETGLKQEYFSIIARNADAHQAERFLEIIREEFRKAADGGLNHRSLMASLNSLEFKYKEADFGGYPKGLIYGLNALDSWLYDDSKPLIHIECSDTFRFLRDSLETGYYEDLVREWLADNENGALVILKPKRGLSEEIRRQTEEKLAAFKASLSEEELEKLIQGTLDLAAYQEAEDTEEQIRTIPLLEREDISRTAPRFSNIEDKVGETCVVRHDYDTNGIAYVSLFFDCNEVSFEDLPYLSLFKSIISFVDTDQYTYSMLNDEINLVSGGLSADTGIYIQRYIDSSYSILCDVSFRTLYGNIPATMALVREILLHSHYDDGKRLYEIIAELKSKLQMVLNTAGHIVASVRAASYHSESAAVREEMNGLAFYKFVEHLESHFEEEKDTLIQKIQELTSRVFKREHLLVSYTGDSQGYESLAKELALLQEELGERSAQAGEVPIQDRRYQLFTGKVERKNEGLKTSSSVQYVARCGKYIHKPEDYHGSIRVFLTIMRFDYLWMKVRVLGGAYGCMCNASSDGSCVFVSYRDPHLKKTNEVYNGIPEYLEQFEADEREMTKYVIGTMSQIDTPLTASQNGARDMSAWLTNTRYEDIQKSREEIIDCTAQDIRDLAPYMRSALEMNDLCVIGGESKIEEARDLFLNVERVIEQ